MTCISCTASIDYLLVMHYIFWLPSPLSHSALFCVILLFFLYSAFCTKFLLVVFFVDFFSCENKSSQKKIYMPLWLYSTDSCMVT